ncbi:MAG: transporter substrate-binding domain-containing protein [Alphaproteobacteria bacterium]|nr:transporter substrate-binding domain-containing protein [Alphaproteobacteria bacterium]
MLAADIWCPINCAPDVEPKGLAIDIAEKIFEAKGYAIKYVAIPWTRALEEARSGEVDGAIGVMKEDDESLIFPQTPLLTVTDDFYVLEGQEFAYTGVESLRGKRLGVVRDYVYSDALTALIESQRKQRGIVQAVGGVTALEQNLRKLEAGRIDVLVEMHPVIEQFLKTNTITAKLKHLGGVDNGVAYVAFTPAKPRSAELARIFDDGVATLRASGELQEIYARYNVELKP